MERRGFRFLEAALSWDGKSTFTLERMSALLARLENPQNLVRSVHVTGSNGKGSVCALISAMLLSAGYRVGQTSSPHLSSPCERCLIDGTPVSEEHLDEVLCRIADVSASLSLAPSYFEVLTAAAFIIFADQKLDWMVVEVGLGGRLDATNTMAKPAACAVTSVSLEHTEILGHTLSDIAREKSGIFRRGVPVVCGVLPEEAIREISSQANRLAAPVESYGVNFEIDNLGIYRGEKSAVPLPFGECSLQGDYQRKNAAVACRVSEILGLSPEHLAQGIRRVRWPGRLELISNWFASASCRVDILLDAAHNPEGIGVLRDYLSAVVTSSRWTKVVFVFSALTRKEWSVMLHEIAVLRHGFEANGVKTDLILTQSTHPHAVPSMQLLEGASQRARIVDLESVLQELQHSAEGNTLLVIAGSMFLLADLRSKIVTEPFRSYIPLAN